MDLQTLLIEGIEFLESQRTLDEVRIANWRDHLNQVNTNTTTPKCPTGYSWDNVLKACVFNG